MSDAVAVSCCSVTWLSVDEVEAELWLVHSPTRADVAETDAVAGGGACAAAAVSPVISLAARSSMLRVTFGGISVISGSAGGFLSRFTSGAVASGWCDFA